MASRPIPQPRQQQQQQQPQPSNKNPPLATSLDIQFSYRQRQLPPGEQVVGSNPSFLAFNDDDDDEHHHRTAGRAHDHTSPYAYFEDDEDGMSSGAEGFGPGDRGGAGGGGGEHSRRGSEDWWEGSESEGGDAESHDGEPEDSQRGAALADEETPRPVYSTLPTFPASLGRSLAAGHPLPHLLAVGRQPSSMIEESPGSSDASPLSSPQQVTRGSTTPAAAAGDSSSVPAPSSSPSYGFPSVALPRTSAPSRSPKPSASSSPSMANYRPSASSNSGGFFAPLRAFISRSSSSSSSSADPTSRRRPDELKPLLPQSHPLPPQGPTSTSSVASTTTSATPTNAPGGRSTAETSPAVSGFSTRSATRPLSSPSRLTPASAGRKPRSTDTPTRTTWTTAGESAGRRSRRAYLAGVFLLASGVLLVVGLGAGLVVFLLGG